MKKLFLHIGYPRTGTKTLQFYLFRKHNEINYLGRHPDRQISHIPIIDKIFGTSDEDYNNKKVNLVNEFKELKFDWSKINLISDEFFLLNDILYDHASLDRSLNRLNDICKENNIIIKVFFNIRNQAGIIKSLYSASYQTSLKTNMEKILDAFINNNKDSYLDNFIKSFNYQEMFFKISQIVGKENVRFFLYECFQNDQEKYLKILSDYLKINEKESIYLCQNKHAHKMSDTISSDSELNSKSQLILHKFKMLELNYLLLKNLPKKIVKFFEIIFTKKKISNNEIKSKRLALQKDFDIMKNNQNYIKDYYRISNRKIFNKFKEEEIFNKFY